MTITWPKFGKSVLACLAASVVGTTTIIMAVIIQGHWMGLDSNGPLLSLLEAGSCIASFAFLLMTIAGLPIQAIMHKFQLDQFGWFTIAGLVTGGILVWSIVRDSTADEHAMGAPIYFGLTFYDWTEILPGAICGLACALTFWLIRRPDKDLKPLPLI